VTRSALVAPLLVFLAFGASAEEVLRIESRDDGERVRADIRGVMPFAFDEASVALKDPDHWCEILLLHLDTKECRVTRTASGTVLQAGVVTHYDQPASTAFRVAFDYRVLQDAPLGFGAQLDASDGPMDTRDFRIVFEASPTRDGRTATHMSYSYAYGAISRLALQLYVVTFGRGKVGFTEAARADDGSPTYVTGMRGVVERNTMRYYLAVEAWLATRRAPRGERLDRALHAWWAAIERYPRQLHELDERSYLEMKRAEIGAR